MIHVDRPPPPKVLLDRGRRAAADALDFFAGRKAVSKRQVKFADFQFDTSLWRAVEPALAELFHEKCAFCESLLSSRAETIVGHFRPTRDAMGLKGATLAVHYCWLAYEWRNLFAICESCSHNKRNMFPIVGVRAPVGATQDQVEQLETRLLLDPCMDYPEEHLVFDRMGRVASVSLETAPAEPLQGHDLGAITIDTFGLNRDDLVVQRAKAAQLTIDALDRALRAAKGNRSRLERTIANLLDPTLPHAMVRRQVTADWLNKIEGLDSIGSAKLAQTDVTQQVQASVPHRERAFERLERHEAEHAHASIQDAVTYARTTRITRVRIEDFRGISELEFEIPTTGWKMLIGENASGKSSILQAVAIALMGRNQANRLRRLGELDPDKLVRRGASSARVLVQQAASMEPIEVSITRRGFEFPRGSSSQKAILLGFGSARWLPRHGSKPPESDDWVRVRNLLNPFVPLGDADRWLRALGPRTNRFRGAEAVIKALLRLPDTTRLRVVAGQLRVHEGSQPRTRALTLDQLSDGYQSALAMATGIMGPLSSKWDVMREAEGVVLIDELDAHLHPRWKMRIVGDLRRAFPNVQFLASTHEPLCLRGLEDREILLLRKVDGHLVYTDDLPSATNMRVDQLLTSRFFGLYSTLDPETERELETYYDLLALDVRTPEQEGKLSELRERVGQAGVLGDTPRDQAVYAIVDTYIAKQLRSGAPAPTRLKPDTEERIADVWRDTIASDPDVAAALAEVLDA